MTLSGLTGCAGLVMAPKTSSPLKHIEFVPLSPGRALVVLVSENGLVENRIIQTSPTLPPSALVEATNYLSARLVGRTLDEAREEIRVELEAHRAELDELTSRVVEDGLATWSGQESEAQLIVSGRAHLLEDVTAVADLERIRNLFEALETKETMLKMVSLADAAEGVQIFIGLRQPAVQPGRLLDDRRSLPEQPEPRARRHRRHRPDAHELRPNHSDGGLHGQADRPPHRLTARDRRKEACQRETQKTPETETPAPEEMEAEAAAAEMPAEEAETEAEEAPEEAAPAADSVQTYEGTAGRGRRPQGQAAARPWAETENVRRRAARDRQDAAKYGIAGFAREMLSVADNLRRALEHVDGGARTENEAIESLASGVEMTERAMLAALERFGVKPIEALGTRFDHNLHEAMFEIEDPSQPTGTVVQELEKGYVLEDRLLRPSRVGVSKGGPAANGNGKEADGDDSPSGKGRQSAYEKQSDAKGDQFDEKL